MTYGPRNPPRFPTALINPIPAAAPSPRKNAVGSDQNGGVKLYRPIAAIDSAAKRAAGALKSELAVRPTAASHAHAAACRRRSPVRSECVATLTIPIAATRNGIAVHMPTARSDAPENAFTICGRKKLKPYPLVTTRNMLSASRQTIGSNRPVRTELAPG